MDDWNSSTVCLDEPLDMEDTNNVKHILVFGSSNVGKTSMLNVLCNAHGETNNNGRGCTFQTETSQLVVNEGKVYQFYDTAGLEETQKGKVLPEAAKQNIANLLKTAKNGFHMLIYVRRSGTILRSDKEHYELFVELLTQQLVPVLCIITGCENEDSMSDYVNTNKPFFIESGLYFIDIVATCFKKGGPMEEMLVNLRINSATAVWKAINSYVPEKPVVMRDVNGFFNICKKFWNRLCDILSIPSWKTTTNLDLEAIFARMGIQDPNTRKDLIDKIRSTH